jgi:hypothetical protein
VTTTEDRHFQLLMSEKEFADSQVGAFFEIHIKVLTFLGAAIVLLGWLYSDKDRSAGDQALSMLALIVAIIGCSVILQGIAVYGTALGYLEYKVTTLADGFARVVPLDEPPYPAFWRWRSSRVQLPVLVSAVALFAMHAGITAVLLVVAWSSGPVSWLFKLGWFAASTYLGVTVTAEILIFRAVRLVMRRSTSTQSSES